MGTYVVLEPRNASAEVSGSSTLVEVSSGSIIIDNSGASSIAHHDYEVADWTNNGDGTYSVSYLRTSHGKGLVTLYQVQRRSSGRWIAATEEFDAGQDVTTGDITVKVNGAGSRCAIRIVVL